jgi:hypothetical protein
MMGPFIGFLFDEPAACRHVGDTTIDRRAADRRADERHPTRRRLWMNPPLWMAAVSRG